MSVMSLANPAVFQSFAVRVVPWLAFLTIVLLALGLWQAFFVAPADYQQGDTVRIMFIHVPAAWLSMFAWSLMSAASLGVLVWRHPLADVAAQSAAPIGAAFTLIALVTGSLWGRPMWGTYWVWDARLTSELVLFLMYLGVIALRAALDEPTRAARLVAILTLVGFVNIPIIKFSVDWWNTLHQPASVFRAGGSTIHASILIPLMINAAAFTLMFITLHLAAMRTELIRRRLRGLRLRAARSGA
ncbi:heme ABC transporter permease [Terrihabitans sp. B22-R8]|uniref:heme ABC transporter permease n=1 Tax=Terrihabitans sp. B22-R8 TaxID=3425128 RepID=UPI00403CC9BB